MRRLSLIALATLVPLTGCTGDEPSSSEPKDKDQGLAAPATGQGVQLKMVSSLAAGVETERCKFFMVPAGGWYVNRQEIRYTPGSHHVLLFTTPYKAIPTVDINGKPVDTSGVFECPDGAGANWEIDAVAGGAQKAHAPAAVQGLPEDVAFMMPEGTVLLMNTHYLNASPGTLETDARINLHFTDKAKVKHQAGILFFYNPFIHVPGKSSAVARFNCPIRSDITLLNGQSHMHKRGVDYVAELKDVGGAVMEQLYTTTEWEEVVMKEYGAAGKALKAGQSIEYQCGYRNNEDRTIVQGLTTRDEMCMFLGLYYPRDPQTEYCALMSERVKDTRFLGGKWIGSGKVDGFDTASCIVNAKPRSQDKGESLYKCVTNSCPKISLQLSSALQCLGSNGFMKCEQACKAGQNCSQCLSTNCQDLVGKLAATTCD